MQIFLLLMMSLVPEKPAAAEPSAALGPTTGSGAVAAGLAVDAARELAIACDDERTHMLNFSLLPQ